jgi:hypothetical protein
MPVQCFQKVFTPTYQEVIFMYWFDGHKNWFVLTKMSPWIQNLTSLWTNNIWVWVLYGTAHVYYQYIWFIYVNFELVETKVVSRFVCQCQHIFWKLHKVYHEPTPWTFCYMYYEPTQWKFYEEKKHYLHIGIARNTFYVSLFRRLLSHTWGLPLQRAMKHIQWPVHSHVSVCTIPIAWSYSASIFSAQSVRPTQVSQIDGFTHELSCVAST